MTRAFAAMALMLTLSSAGCTAMCQAPWDYCNAVLDGSGTPNCNFGARYNSSFAPMNGTPPTTPIGPTPAAADATAGDEQGEITDSYLEPLPE